MEENTTSETNMNPNSIVERVTAPVIVNQTEPAKSYDEAGMLNNLGIQRLQHDVGDTNRDVKDAEGHIIAKLGDARYEGAKSEAAEISATKDVTKDVLSYLNSQRNAADAQFLALNNRLCESEKTTMEGDAKILAEVIKQGYEAKLAAKDAIIDSSTRFQHLSERLSDKAQHYFEETTEKQNECCCGTERSLAIIAAALKVVV